MLTSLADRDHQDQIHAGEDGSGGKHAELGVGNGAAVKVRTGRLALGNRVEQRRARRASGQQYKTNRTTVRRFEGKRADPTVRGGGKRKIGGGATKAGRARRVG